METSGISKEQKHLIIGNKGEVGAAIFQVLEEGGYNCYGTDKKEPRTYMLQFEVIHVCIPFSAYFVGEVDKYTKQYLAEGGLLIIHSTLPPIKQKDEQGIASFLGAVHSPVRGVHPNLAEGIKTFVKFFGGPRAEEAAAIFEKIGIKTRITPKAENTEALKLWDTGQMRAFILWEKRIQYWCEVLGLDFDFIYTEANKTYNEGYMALGRPEVVRPFYKHVPGKIGGHCLEQNWELLDYYGFHEREPFPL